MCVLFLHFFKIKNDASAATPVVMHYLCVLCIIRPDQIRLIVAMKKEKLVIFPSHSIAVYAIVFCILNSFAYQKAHAFNVQRRIKQHYIIRTGTHFVSLYNCMNHHHDRMKRELKPNKNKNVENVLQIQYKYIHIESGTIDHGH